MQLANLLHQQERSAEAEPLLRELRANLRQHGIEDDSVNSKLLEVVLALERVESGEDSSRHVSKRRQKADAVVNELLDQMVRASARSNDTTLSFKVAVMLMWFGREEEHLLMCQRFMNEAAQKPNDPYVAAQAARIFGVRRSADLALRDQALQLARQAAELEADRRRRGWCQQTVGIAEFRAGNWDAAEQMLLRAEEIAKDFASQDPKLQRYIEGPAGLFRAMILFHSGKQAEARKLFAQAVSQMPPLPEDDRQVLFNGSTTNDLLFWLTYREASALFQTALGP
jgi:tetratricopeptide (TPR) repeat protein